MSVTKYINGIALFALSSAPIFGLYGKTSEFFETPSPQVTRVNKQIIESFHLNLLKHHGTTEEKIPNNIVDAKTKQPLNKELPKTTPLRSAPLIYTGPLETMLVPDVLIAYLHEGDSMLMDKIAQEIDSKFEKYKERPKKLADARKKAALLSRVEAEWVYINKCAQDQKSEKHRATRPILSKDFYVEPEPSTIYDVIREQRVTNHHLVVPAFYDEQPPNIARKWFVKYQHNKWASLENQYRSAPWD